VSDTIYERRDPSQSTWRGRQRRGEKDSNSFATFVSRAKRTNEGKDHLKRHHGGHGL
jgi:hypothetical protein